MDSPPHDTADYFVRHYARANMLALVGSVLFSNKSGADVRLFMLPLLHDLEEAGTISWSSVVLACLYSELCRVTRPTNNQYWSSDFLVGVRVTPVDRPNRRLLEAREGVLKCP